MIERESSQGTERPLPGETASERLPPRPRLEEDRETAPAAPVPEDHAPTPEAANGEDAGGGEPERPGRSKQAWAEFQGLPLMEKLAGAGSVALVFGIAAAGGWTRLFALKEKLFHTFAFLAALAVIGILCSRAFGKDLLEEGARRKVIGVLGLLPIAAFLIDLLREPGLLLLTGATVVLGYAGWRLFESEFLEDEEEPDAPTG